MVMIHTVSGVGQSSQRDTDNRVNRAKPKPVISRTGCRNSQFRQVRTHREESAIDKVQNVNEGQGGERGFDTVP